MGLGKRGARILTCVPHMILLEVCDLSSQLIYEPCCFVFKIKKIVVFS